MATMSEADDAMAAFLRKQAAVVMSRRAGAHFGGGGGNAKKPGWFCKMCDVQFNQSKTEHGKSKEHKNLKQFLHPSCGACGNLNFTNRPDYYAHKVTVEHLTKLAGKTEEGAQQQAVVPREYVDELDTRLDMLWKKAQKERWSPEAVKEALMIQKKIREYELPEYCEDNPIGNLKRSVLQSYAIRPFISYSFQASHSSGQRPAGPADSAM